MSPNLDVIIDIVIRVIIALNDVILLFSLKGIMICCRSPFEFALYSKKTTQGFLCVPAVSTSDAISFDKEEMITLLNVLMLR